MDLVVLNLIVLVVLGFVLYYRYGSYKRPKRRGNFTDREKAQSNSFDTPNRRGSIRPPGSAVGSRAQTEHVEPNSEGRSRKPERFRISIAYPKLLSKRYTASFLVQFYTSTYVNKAKENIRNQYYELQPVVHEYKSDVTFGEIVKVRLSCPEITFSDVVIKSLNNKISTISFLGRPNDECHPGVHYATLTISDPETNEEYNSLNFPVRVVDFVFDHISRPLLSNVMSAALGVGSLAVFMLTLLGQIDTTLGVASGTTAVAVAGGFHYYIFSVFQKRNVNTP